MPSSLAIYAWTSLAMCACSTVPQSSLAVSSQSSLAVSSQFSLAISSQFSLATCAHSHYWPLVICFHWLPVHSKIQHKISSLCENQDPVLNTCSMSHVEAFTRYTHSRHLKANYITQCSLTSSVYLEFAVI